MVFMENQLIEKIRQILVELKKNESMSDFKISTEYIRIMMQEMLDIIRK